MQAAPCDGCAAVATTEEIAMRSYVVLVLVAAGISWSSPGARAEQADACKQCGDQQRRCMSNYPGPTCKVDYDICMKNCRKK